MDDQTTFINYISAQYERLKNKYRKYCSLNHYDWDEDIFSDTVVKCYDVIEKKGKLNDTSPEGMESYFFQSFKTNLKREKQYSRNAKRDKNNDNIEEDYDTWFNEYNESPSAKIKSDLWKDYATIYLITRAEEEFDSEHLYLFKLKYLQNLTYRELADKTKKKGVRQKVLTVKNWLKDNVTKDEVRKAFGEHFGDFL